jgi:vanillate O-demethylase monooxygenase subunit
MFPRNFWYVAGWDWEVWRKELMPRTICNEPIVFWRKQDGTPAALEDRCCHRHMPLSHGKLRGSDVECLYHGLLYRLVGEQAPDVVRIQPGAERRRGHDPP